jgi:Zn-dependent metalloprotease
MCVRNPLHCIIPPFMLESMAERGSPRQQDYARRCLESSTGMRAARDSTIAGLRSAALEGATAAVTKERIVYSANFGTNLPGQRLRGEGDPPTGDAAADEAYDGSGHTYDLYQQVYARDSIDGNNLRLDSTVHYDRGFDNAFWDGRQMVYGDGDDDLPPDQRLFSRFTKSLDVIGHELTHGVTQYTANLAYQSQAGALNEHFSDVFGVLVKQWHLNQAAANADWLVGAELLTDNVHGNAIRSMKAPGTAYDDPVLGRDPQPAHMNDYVSTTQDNGGVHINSGIPNHAFYRIAVDLGGRAWEKAGTIWYRALTAGRLSTNAGFQDVVNLTSAIAGDLYGAGSAEQTAVHNGWAAVGLGVAAAPPPPSGCNPFGSLFARGR